MADSLEATIQKVDTTGASTYLKEEVESLSRMLEGNPADSLVVSRLNQAIYSIGTEGDAVRTLNNVLEKFCSAKIAKVESLKERQYYKLFYAKALNTEAEFLHQEDRTEEKLALRFEALEIAKEIKDTSLVVEIFQNFAIDYFNSANYIEADKYYTQAVELEALRNNPKRLLQAKVRQADVLIMLGKIQEAIDINEEFLKMVTEEKDEISMLNTQYSLGVAYKKQGNLDKASFYLKQAKTGMEAYNYLAGVGQILKELALIAEAQKDWDTMYRYGLDIQEIAEKTGYPQIEKNATQILYMAYGQRGEYKKSLEEYRKFIALRDSITGRERTRQMLEQEHAYELKQDSVQDAAQLAIEVESRKRSQNTALASWVILGLILIFAAILWNRYRFIQKQKKQLDLANEELKQLDKAKSRFFANISHELRTPLTVISGMTNLLEESETRSLIKNNSGKLLSLVNQILDLSKLRANKLHFNLKQDDIIPWLRYLVESFQSYAESKAIELEFRTDKESLVMDYDYERVSSIVTNLLSNAIKFTSKGGKVSLVASMEGKFLLIRVQDNGIGIPGQSKEHIFDRFFQVDDSNTRHGDGTGIGLALTKELVEAFGGSISVESTEGEGSVFSVKLPIENKAPVAEQEEGLSLIKPGKKVSVHHEEEGPVGSAPYSLLVVEDNDDLITYLKAILSPHYKLLIARDGAEGIDLAIREVPDLILSDVMMPNKDGFELCQTLKEDDRTSHIPIVLLTARSDAESRISGLSRGADAYLPKPFDQEELMVRLENLVKLRQRLQTRYQSEANGNAASDSQTEKEGTFIQKLRNLILERIADPALNVAMLCELIGMSRTQLHNKIKALTGLSTSRFLRQVRMQEARKLLLETDLQIAEIAFKCGYIDPPYFTRMFVSEFGETPSELRKG